MKPAVDLLLEVAKPSEFARRRLGIDLDAIQESILNGKVHRVILNCSRQWGKSMLAVVTAVLRMLTQKGCLVLATGPAARQPAEFLAKVEGYLRQLGVSWGRVKGQDLSLQLQNGSRLIGLPGNGPTSRGFTAHMLVVDEAAFAPDPLYDALRPSVSQSRGDVWLLSTPNGRKGFFYRAWTNTAEAWTKVLGPATECPRIPKSELDANRQGMTASVFAREFLCRFEEGDWAFFSGDSIEKAVQKDLEPIRLHLPGAYRAPVKDVPLGRGQGTPFVLAGDLGMRASHSAAVLIEPHLRHMGQDKATWAQVYKKVLRVRLVDRIALGTLYKDVRKRLAEIAGSAAVAGLCDLVVDGTGVGEAVAQELRGLKMASRVVDMKITGGGESRGTGLDRKVPRIDLLDELRGALDRGEIEIAAGLSETGTLVSELTEMRMGGKKGASDDLAMALAMGVWWARQGLGWK